MSEENVDISPNQDKGVLKRIIQEGTGTELPSAGCQVTVHYTGTLLDGTKFDSSKDRNDPFQFDLGKGSVIKAWDIGVATMKKGEVCMLTCAPEYAYGERGSGAIPPNATLQFEIEMIDWDGEDLSPKKNKAIVRFIEVQGNGFDNPNDGAQVTVELEGKVKGSDKPFDKRTITFNLGEGSEVDVCDGIERALEKFKRGETSRLVIQPKHAFKAEGSSKFGVPPDATVEYLVTLKNFEKAKDSWSLDTEERIVQGRIFKEKGTEYFKKDKIVLAIKMYNKTVDFLSSESVYDEAGTKERNELLLSAYLNLSLCYLKTNPKHPLEASKNAAKALEIDANNVKALFRKGQAMLSIGDLDQAIESFQRVVTIEPENKAAANQITICNSNIKQHKEKEKKIYANMFEKFAQRDRETEIQIAKEMPDVMDEALGEWGAPGSGEWAQSDRNREPSEFEKQNPNILMIDKDGQFQNM